MTVYSSLSSGNLRRQSDMRQIGALLMLLGFCAILQPLSGIAGAIGPNGATATRGHGLASFIGDICLVIIGAFSLFTGYSQCVHDRGSKYLTLFMIFFTQTGIITYVSGMGHLARTAANQSALIPRAYSPTQFDYNFVAAMGILGIASYGFAFIGSISFMQFSLWTFQKKRPQDRNAEYYRGRLKFYCGLLFVAGLSQLMLGVFVYSSFGGAELQKHGPIAAAMYVVSFPSLTVIVGAWQMVNALHGLTLSQKKIDYDENYCFYQLSIFVGWAVQLSLQIVTQIGYLPGSHESQALSALAALSFGLNVMPAFLEFKARSTPEVIEIEYYGNSTDKGSPPVFDSV